MRHPSSQTPSSGVHALMLFQARLRGSCATRVHCAPACRIRSQLGIITANVVLGIISDRASIKPEAGWVWRQPLRGRRYITLDNWLPGRRQWVSRGFCSVFRAILSDRFFECESLTKSNRILNVQVTCIELLQEYSLLGLSFERNSISARKIGPNGTPLNKVAMVAVRSRLRWLPV